MRSTATTAQTERREKRREAMGEKQAKRDLRSDLLLIAALIAWAFFVNRQFRISGLYKDDLYTWSCLLYTSPSPRD